MPDRSLLFTDMFYENDIKDKKLLLHVCCGPCSLGAIEPLLSDGAIITLFYYNPCIIDGEFEKRLEALNTVAAHYRLPLVVPPHDYGVYLDRVKDNRSDREGGERCSLCMGERLEFASRYAAENGFDAYTTTLTVSPHKNSKTIFSLAENIHERGIGAPFLKRDFKKNNGFLLSCNLARQLGIYRQRFCGCEFSCAAAGIDVAEYSAMVKAEYAHLSGLRSGEW